VLVDNLVSYYWPLINDPMPQSRQSCRAVHICSTSVHWSTRTVVWMKTAQKRKSSNATKYLRRANKTRYCLTRTRNQHKDQSQLRGNKRDDESPWVWCNSLGSFIETRADNLMNFPWRAYRSGKWALLEWWFDCRAASRDIAMAVGAIFENTVSCSSRQPNYLVAGWRTTTKDRYWHPGMLLTISGSRVRW